MMTVAELIEFLKTQPQELQVAYKCYSEQILMTADEIAIYEGCEPRADGWIHHHRGDKPSRKYLLFPGN